MKKLKASVGKIGGQKQMRAIKGPEPERLKIQGNWVDAVDTALAKKRPLKGWPK